MQYRDMTPAQSAALRRYREKRIEAGYVAATHWFSSGAMNRLKLLAKTYGSQEKVLEALLGED